MTAGALVLMALDKGSISQGPFNLSAYERLGPIEKTVDSVTAPYHKWDSIELFYSGTAGNDKDMLLSPAGDDQSRGNFHFVILNGLGVVDGKTRFMSRWQKQQSCLPAANFRGDGGTIRICVISDGLTTLPSELQITRASKLVLLLTRRFNISPAEVSYPTLWQR